MNKRLKLRHNEYYNFQDTLDGLYSESQQGKHFRKLISIMNCESNILLAYRNIKRNGGKNTPGVDGQTMKDIEKLHPDVVIKRIQEMFRLYKPQPVRRKMIPKANGKERPLGIPCIWDRLFQQCILQILEPICEAKFHNHSYGFRANRGTHHAIARMNSLINKSGLHHCVDIDIKGFFDNVHHGKLLKQMWSLGIRDKKLLSIISTLIKAEIKGEGKPTKGTPQGGILSPLLSNIVLNELDWWISDQWETFESEHKYAALAKYRALKKTNLKEIYIVRYADDFKILCRTRNQAIKTKIAVEKFLNERLHLECSEEKSKVINLKKQWSDFLGLQLKAVRKGNNETKKTKRVTIGYDKETGKQLRETVVTGITYTPKYVCMSRMSKKAKQNAKEKITTAIKAIKKNISVNKVRKYNSTVIGIQNYYKVATLITQDLSEINFRCQTVLYNRLRLNLQQATIQQMSESQQKRYQNYKPKLYALKDVALVPIYAQKNEPSMNFSQEISNFTEKGRKLIHKKLITTAAHIMLQQMDKYSPNRSIEYHDNRISKFISQHGKCYVTEEALNLSNWHCHHIIPYHISKDDSFRNLVVVTEEIHRLIHMTDIEKIEKALLILKLNSKNLKKLNNLREKANTGIVKWNGNKAKVAV